jgi:poly-beta-1,6-N-acetyl-D-glucosamine synthase
MLAEDNRVDGELTLALVTPARNEAAFLECTIQSVIEQTVRPVRWIIVSDGSTDRTDEIIKSYAARHDWIEYLRMPERLERHFGGKAFAFNAGYERLRTQQNFDVIGNLDADITLDRDHFAFLLQKFSQNKRLGCGGAPFRDGKQQYDYRFTSIEHVSGACQLFRRECFEQIGGYKPVRLGGVDLIAVITARMKGWETRSFPEKVCIHHRLMGSAQRGMIQIAFKGGMADYQLGGHPVWEVFRSIYQTTRRPFIIGGVLRFLGFFWAMASRKPKAVSSELARFRQKEQMGRLRAWPRNLFRGFAAAPRQPRIETQYEE